MVVVPLFVMAYKLMAAPTSTSSCPGASVKLLAAVAVFAVPVPMYAVTAPTLHTPTFLSVPDSPAAAVLKTWTDAVVTLVVWGVPGPFAKTATAQSTVASVARPATTVVVPLAVHAYKLTAVPVSSSWLPADTGSPVVLDVAVPTPTYAVTVPELKTVTFRSVPDSPVAAVLKIGTVPVAVPTDEVCVPGPLAKMAIRPSFHLW